MTEFVELGSLSEGDSFEYADPRRPQPPDGQKTRWQVSRIGLRFCDVIQECEPSGADRNTFPALPMRLASTTQVQRTVQDQTAQQKVKKMRILELAHDLYLVAEGGGPTHSYWDVVFDMRAFVKGELTIAELTADEWIAHAERLLNVGD